LKCRVLFQINATTPSRWSNPSARFARALGKETIVEHVEDGTILEKLKRHRVEIDYVQGHHIAQPRLLEGMTGRRE